MEKYTKILVPSFLGITNSMKYLVWTIISTMATQTGCFRKIPRYLERVPGCMLGSNKSARNVWTAVQQERGQTWKNANSQWTDIPQSVSQLNC